MLGCLVGRCAYLATAATVLQTARLGAGAVVAVGGVVHAGAVVPDGFARVAFGVDAEWTDRLTRYELAAEVRVAEFDQHADDDLLDR